MRNFLLNDYFIFSKFLNKFQKARNLILCVRQSEIKHDSMLKYQSSQNGRPLSLEADEKTNIHTRNSISSRGLRIDHWTK